MISYFQKNILGTIQDIFKCFSHNDLDNRICLQFFTKSQRRYQDCKFAVNETKLNTRNRKSITDSPILVISVCYASVHTSVNHVSCMMQTKYSITY